MASRVVKAEPVPPVTAEDRMIPGPAGDIPIRTYTPEGKGPFGALVYYHGGGWVLGNIAMTDLPCRMLARESGCVVVSVDYRLAPEHKFPAPAEDCYAAVKWLADNASALNCDAARIAAGGTSAGGNLAAAVALMARDRGGPKIAFQLLIYPRDAARTRNRIASGICHRRILHSVARRYGMVLEPLSRKFG